MATGRKPPSSRKQEREQTAAARLRIAQEACSRLSKDIPVPKVIPPPVQGNGKGSHAISDVVHLDEERARQAASMLLAGCTYREIADRTSVSYDSMPGILAGLEQRGIIQPLRDRLRDAAGRLAEITANGSIQAAEVLTTDTVTCSDPKALAARSSSAKTLALMFSIANSAHQLATGQPTEIVEHRARPAADDWRSWVKSQAIDAEVVPSSPDSQSGEITRLAEHSEQDEPDATSNDTDEPEQEPADAGMDDRAGGVRVREAAWHTELVQGS